jgi:hypothetical protein
MGMHRAYCMRADPGGHARLQRRFAKIEGSNPVDGMDVLLLCLLCVV